MSMPRFSLLTSRNPKTSKGRAKGYAVAVLHLAPFNLSGRNVCPKATAGCVASCLNLAGRGGMAPGSALTFADVSKGKRTNTIQAARLRRTRMLFEDRAGFMALLRADILKLWEWCQREGFRPVLRLNGTSDLDWEGMAPDVIRLTRDLGVMRYDYTKVATRSRRVADDYRVTFSLAENNDAEALQALRGGMNVAAVFTTRKGQPLPSTYSLGGVSFPVIDGDEDDLRFLDPPGVIVGLRAKGPARYDTSGFVRAV